MSKRPISLVSYSSDSEEDIIPLDLSPAPAAVLKKRKLPPPPTKLLPQIPFDDPSEHHGRKRTVPHVEGQYAAHVYIPVALDRESAPRLRKFLKSVFSHAKESIPTLHAFANLGRRSGSASSMPSPPSAGHDGAELHISLSRPIYLRAHQRESLIKAVKTVANSGRPFSASFASFSQLTNDELTRSFLALEVGAGHNELRELSEALTPVLEEIRQKPYYPEPRFHASYAWALLNEPEASVTAQGNFATGSGQPLEEPLPAIDHFPQTLLTTLEEIFGKSLRGHAGRFDVGEVKLRIGRDIIGWGLGE